MEIPSGVEGNVVIGVNRPGDAILWSWHLWITNYDPYSYKLQPIEGKYIYRVNGGNMHRYDGESWISGEYKDQFMMDRDIGALSDRYNSDTKGHICFQFGRKDALPGSNYYLGGTDLKTGSLNFQYRDLTGSIPMGDNLKYSIANPLTVIAQPKAAEGWWDNGWIINAKYVKNECIWFDPITQTGKSIFDPSPIGFCVPLLSAYSSFTSITNAKPTTNGISNGTTDYKRNFPPLSTYLSMLYWPYGDGSDIPAEVIYFPRAFVRTNGGDKTTTYKWWASTYIKGNQVGHAITANDWNSMLSSSGAANPLPVRCVSYTRIY